MDFLVEILRGNVVVFATVMVVALFGFVVLKSLQRGVDYKKCLVAVVTAGVVISIIWFRMSDAQPERQQVCVRQPAIPGKGVLAQVTWVKHNTAGEMEGDSLKGEVVWYDQNRFSFNAFFTDYNEEKVVRYEGAPSLKNPREFSGTWTREGMPSPGKWQLFQFGQSNFQGTLENETGEVFSLAVETYITVREEENHSSN
ncbi:MAG: hypothetical protein CMI58_01245 [Parcubacteria group bacterium]|jgi:hypothetical protein|nr:hypothetical protein [Parcubacteria group bacterium]|tara:strand:- start:452 stop:1048 length:597 start_codon:yes stop_codon:yes gene_type:complete